MKGLKVEQGIINVAFVSLKNEKSLFTTEQCQSSLREKPHLISNKLVLNFFSSLLPEDQSLKMRDWIFFFCEGIFSYIRSCQCVPILLSLNYVVFLKGYLTPSSHSTLLNEKLK